MACQPLGIEDAVLLEHLGDDGYGRVDGVGDDKDECFWSRSSNSSCQIADDTGVDLEECSE